MSSKVRFGFPRSVAHGVLALSLLSSSTGLGRAAAQAQAPVAPPPAAPPVAQPAPAPTAQPTYPTQAAPVYPAQPAPPPGQPGAYQQGYQQGTPPGQQPYAPAPSPMYAPQTNLPPPRMGWHPLARPSKGLMITGISILGASYLLAISVGASIIDGNEDEYDDGDVYDGDCRHCKDVAPWLFVPVAGPFIAMTETPNDAGLLMLGMVEVVGAGLMIGGIIRYKNTKRAAEMQQFGHFQLRDGRELALDVSTGGRLVGPRMTLRF